MSEKTDKYFAKYPLRKKANGKYRNALKNGVLKKPDSCQDCKAVLPKRSIQGHHADYNKPLEVEWLCPKCHTKRHLPRRKYEDRILTDANVREIRRLYKPREFSQRKLAKMFKVARITIRGILDGSEWQHLL